METYITISKIDSQCKFAAGLGELKQGLELELELCQPRGRDGEGGGREIQEGGDICAPMADSCCCLTENNNILSSNYPSIEKF